MVLPEMVSRSRSGLELAFEAWLGCEMRQERTTERRAVPHGTLSPVSFCLFLITHFIAFKAYLWTSLSTDFGQRVGLLDMLLLGHALRSSGPVPLGTKGNQVACKQ